MLVVRQAHHERVLCEMCAQHGALRLHASSAAEPDGHLSVLDDDRHRAPLVAVLQHALQRCGVLLDVDVFERNVPPLIIGPGGLRVGSGVFAEDVDHGSIVADHSL